MGELSGDGRRVWQGELSFWQEASRHGENAEENLRERGPRIRPEMERASPKTLREDLRSAHEVSGPSRRNTPNCPWRNAGGAPSSASLESRNMCWFGARQCTWQGRAVPPPAGRLLRGAGRGPRGLWRIRGSWRKCCTPCGSEV